MDSGSRSDGQRRTIEDLLALDLSDQRRRTEPPAPPCPHGMRSAKSCVECMEEVGLGSASRRATKPVRRWQDELPKATVAMLVDFADDIVRAGQNTADSAKDYRGYVAQALVLLAERTAWVDLDTNVKSGCRSFIRWAGTARPSDPARRAALEAARDAFASAGAR